MTLPASGTITLAEVNVELGLAAAAPISLNDAAVRALFGKPSGGISLSDGWGKSSNTLGFLPLIGFTAATVDASFSVFWEFRTDGTIAYLPYSGAYPQDSSNPDTYFTSPQDSGSNYEMQLYVAQGEASFWGVPVVAGGTSGWLSMNQTLSVGAYSTTFSGEFRIRHKTTGRQIIAAMTVY